MRSHALMVSVSILLLVLASTLLSVSAYTSGVPPVDRRALAGLWKLTPSVRSIKEFTVHPRKPPKKKTDEVLLMLKEDGSFIRYEQLETEDDEDEDDTTKKEDVNQSWKQYIKKDNNKDQPIKTLFKGTWDYRDGELILAADRDEQRAKSDNYDIPSTDNDNTNNTDNQQQHKPNAKQQHLFWKKGKDTILVGAVVATQNRHYNNDQPQQNTLSYRDDTSSTNVTSSSTTKTPQQPSALRSSSSSSQPQKLSVPMGSVQVGKFFYPKNHPSFFDQPIFQPKRFGTFQLKQVLGNSLGRDEEHEAKLVEKFRNQDFHNKRFFLTSSPIEPRRPKGNVRWSIKYNKYVEDPPSKEAQKAADAEKNRLVSTIRVMKVMIHPNNTFSTLAGLGDTTNILRGRFNVIGDQRDYVWMQSVRFGFGRSVSGSTYSEGNALGEETKSYWGKISYEDDDDDEEASKSDNDPTAADGTTPDQEKEETDEKPKRLQVKGTVLVGWGLEPQPIARFIMREADDDDFDDEEEEDDDDDDEEEEEADDTPTIDTGDDEEEEDPWSSPDAFQ